MLQIATIDLVIIGDYTSDARYNGNRYASRGVLVEGVLLGSTLKLSSLIFKVRYNVDDVLIDFDETISIDDFEKVLNLNMFSSYDVNSVIEYVASNYLKDSLEDGQISIREYIGRLGETDDDFEE